MKLQFKLLVCLLLSETCNSLKSEYAEDWFIAAEKSAETDQHCTLLVDGSCVSTGSKLLGTTFNSSTNLAFDDELASNIDIPPLRDIDSNGMYTTGYGAEQMIGTGDEMLAYQSFERLRSVHSYMYNEVYTKMVHLKHLCVNTNEYCTTWAAAGECDVNPKYMTTQCAPACFSCDKLLFDSRCPMNESHKETDIWKGPGNVNKMFDTIATSEFFKNAYGKMDVVLRPGVRPPTNNPEIDDSPWIIIIDDFLTDHECQTLIDLGTARGYQRSTGTGEDEHKVDGTYGSVITESRTSSNTWCLEDCVANTTTQVVLNKILNLTSIPIDNYEALQLLKYDVDQYYWHHHDFIDHHLRRLSGVRLATVFLYLNDVEAGGGTKFPLLNVTVMPKRGRALIWPSVLDEDPNQPDPRTLHEALIVEKGVKYGANAWIHMRNFLEPWSRGCA